MPTQSKPLPTSPKLQTSHDDFTKRCHYTRLQHLCTHQIWSRSPHVVHRGNCQLSPRTKSRCGNMASRPKIVMVAGLCSKCKPVEFGVGGGLKKFEFLVPPRGLGESEDGRKEFEAEGESGREGSVVCEDCDGEEQDRVTKTAVITSTPQIQQPNTALLSSLHQYFTPSPVTPAPTQTQHPINPPRFNSSPAESLSKWQEIDPHPDQNADLETEWESITNEEKPTKKLWREKDDWIFVKPA